MYRVALEAFEGPLDLLLYLVRKEEVDIYDIPIARITDGWFCRECEKYGTEPVMPICPHCSCPTVPRDFDFYMSRWSTEKDGPLLPGAYWRWCTKHLKIRPFDRYVGRDEANIYIGIRYDESDRDGNYGDKPNVSYRYPFVEDEIDLDGVMAILESAKIELPSFYKWRSTGGCWCCPFQRKSDWANLAYVHPELFQKAVEEEERSNFTWRQGTSLKAIQAEAVTQLTLFGNKVFERDAPLSIPCLICAK